MASSDSMKSPSLPRKLRKTYSSSSITISGVRRFSNGLIERPRYRGSSQMIYRDLSTDEYDDDEVEYEPIDELISAPRKMWYHSNKIINFYTLYTGLHILVTIIAGGIMSNIDNYDFLDGFFMAISAITGSSLVVIISTRCSSASFSILALLIYFGNPFWALGIWPTLAKYYRYRQKKIQMEVQDVKNKRHFYVRYHAVEATLFIMISYLILWHAFTILALIGALRIQPIHPQLAARNWTNEAFALFVAICGFGNTGFSLTDDALFYYIDNALFYFIVSLSIMAGLTMAPVFLRIWIHIVIDLRLLLNCRVSSYENLLVHGEDYSVFLFSYKRTVYLFIANLLIYGFQFFFFMFSSYTTENIALYGSISKLVGVAYFHSIASRYCGYQMVDFQKLSIGMLVVYALSMYTHAIPFLSTDIFNENISLVKMKNDINNDSKDSFEEIKLKVESETKLEQKSKKVTTAIFNTEAIKKVAIVNFSSHFFWLIVAVIIIAHTENTLIQSDSKAYNFWYILFECISAYGTVGYSVGVSTQPSGFALSGDFSQAGKLVIMCLMMLGKHRGMPDPDSFCMDFTLSEFDTFQLADDDIVIQNNNVVVSPEIIEGITVQKKKSYVNLGDMISLSNFPSSALLENSDDEHVDDDNQNKKNNNIIQFDI